MYGDIEHIAKVCHEANRAFCESMGDFSQVGWNRIPKWQHDSIVEGVVFILSNPGAGPEASHNAWMEHKFENLYLKFCKFVKYKYIDCILIR